MDTPPPVIYSGMAVLVSLHIKCLYIPVKEIKLHLLLSFHSDQSLSYSYFISEKEDSSHNSAGSDLRLVGLAPGDSGNQAVELF